MAEVNRKVKTVLPIVSFLLLQGCASTEELFAEYDAKECAVPQTIVKEKVKVVKETIVKVEKAPLPDSLSIDWKPAVYFGTNQSEVTAKEMDRLRVNFATLSRLADHKISLHGFTDQQGNVQYNEKLSKKRVASVTKELIALGLAPDRIIGAAYGEEYAAADDKEGPVERDRRVDMILLDADMTPVHQQPKIEFKSE